MEQLENRIDIPENSSLIDLLIKFASLLNQKSVAAFDNVPRLVMSYMRQSMKRKGFIMNSPEVPGVSAERLYIRNYMMDFVEAILRAESEVEDEVVNNEEFLIMRLFWDVDNIDELLLAIRKKARKLIRDVGPGIAGRLKIDETIAEIRENPYLKQITGTTPLDSLELQTLLSASWKFDHGQMISSILMEARAEYMHQFRRLLNDSKIGDLSSENSYPFKRIKDINRLLTETLFEEQLVRLSLASSKLRMDHNTEENEVVDRQKMESLENSFREEVAEMAAFLHIITPQELNGYYLQRILEALRMFMPEHKFLMSKYNDEFTKLNES